METEPRRNAYALLDSKDYLVDLFSLPATQDMEKIEESAARQGQRIVRLSGVVNLPEGVHDWHELDAEYLEQFMAQQD